MKKNLLARKSRQLKARIRPKKTLVQSEELLSTLLLERKHLKEELQASERRLHHFREHSPYQYIFQNASWGMSLATPENHFIQVNEAFAKMHGASVGEWVGRSLLDMFAEESKSMLPELTKQVHESGHILYESIHIRKDGSKFPVFTEVTAFKDSAGSVVFRAANFRDITELKKAEVEIQHGRAQIEAAFQAMSDGVVVFDLTGEIVLLNEAAARIYGFENAEAMKKNLLWFSKVYNFFTLEGKQVPVEQWPVSRVLRGESISEWELRGRRTDTEQKWLFSFSGEPVRDEQGKPVLAVIVTRDITAVKQIQQSLVESEERFHALADNIPQLAWMTNADGWIFWYNKRWYDYTGTIPDEVVGWGWEKVHHPDHVTRVVSFVSQAWKKGEPWELTFPLRSSTGEWRWFLTRAVPIRDAEERLIRWFGTNTDVTEQLQVQDDLRKTEHALREAVRSRDEFLSIASHELKTPLTSLKIQLQLTRRKIRPEINQAPPPEKLAKVMEISTRQVDRLTRLVEDLLDVSRIEAGKLALNIEPTNLSLLVWEVLDRLADQLKEANCTVIVQIQEAIQLECDRFRLEQVIINLLTNAMKYARGKPIEIQAQRKNQRIRLKVHDHGIGIAKEQQNKIFERFERIASPNNVSGLGLGLFICNQIVLAHHGKIWVKSTLGEGSTFNIDLPVKQSESENHAK